jgi:DNA-binding NtrC family response regulator
MTDRYLSYYLHMRKRETEGAKEALPTLEELEVGYIEYLLGVTGGNLSETARILAISRSSLYFKLHRSGIAQLLDRISVTH